MKYKSLKDLYFLGVISDGIKEVIENSRSEILPLEFCNSTYGKIDAKSQEYRDNLVMYLTSYHCFATRTISFQSPLL